MKVDKMVINLKLLKIWHHSRKNVQVQRSIGLVNYNQSLFIRNGIVLYWVAFEEKYFLGSKIRNFMAENNKKMYSAVEGDMLIDTPT